MILISVQNLAKSFGMHQVLRDVTFSLQKGEKMGLVGVNGCGKTTLMRLISGQLQPEEGAVHIGKELRIGYLAQREDIALTDTLWEALLRVFEPVRAMERRLAQLEAELEQSAGDEAQALRLSAEYQRLTEQFARMEGYAYQGEMLRVLAGLGLPVEMHQRQVSTLSGGERTRLSLAKLLLQKPDVLLMDEPTNHLDLAAIEWLQDYLVAYKGTLLLISHDRYFLDRVCTTMGELLGGQLMKFSGNYTQYMKKRTADFETRLKAFHLQQKEIEREEAIIQRYRRFNREKSIRAAESRQRRLDKVERLEKPTEEHHVRFSFDIRRRSGEEALVVKGLEKAFEGRTLFRDVSFSLRTGDRVALIGANGVGKSTLFTILMNQLAPDRGTVTYGANVDIGYYDQHQQNLSPSNTVLDEVWNAFPTLEQSAVRGALGLFLFTGDEVFESISTLSGGERGRVALTKLMLKKDNLLLLDEPTNHLDMDSCEVLEEALAEFPGTILAISHDRYFINRFAQRVMVMEGDGMTEYLGNFDDYMEKRDRPQPPPAEAQGKTKTAQIKERKAGRQQSARIRELRAHALQVEADILKSEEQIAALEAQLSAPETYGDSALMMQVTQSYQAEKERQAALYDDLEAAEARVAQAEEEGIHQESG